MSEKLDCLQVLLLFAQSNDCLQVLLLFAQSNGFKYCYVISMIIIQF